MTSQPPADKKDKNKKAPVDLVVYEESHILAAQETQPLERHPAAVYLARLSPGSRPTMQAALHTIAAALTSGRCDLWSLEWTQIRYQHTAAVRAVLSERYAPATANKFLAALRGVLKEAWRLGYLSAEEYQRAADMPPVRGTSLPRGRALASGELRALFEACARDERAAGARDAAMMAVLYGAGLRRAELVALDLAEYHPADEQLRVRRGKGRKARLAYTPPGCAAALEAWLEFRGLEAGPLFCRINKGSKFHLHRLSGKAVLLMLDKRAQQAGVDDFSPHDMRRTFIGDLLEAGADIATVQQLAGHANIQTTARYDRRGEATRRKAVGLLHVPYQRTPRL